MAGPTSCPGLDLGLVIAAQHLKKLRKRPDAKRLLKIAEAWRPWRSAAALLLWHYRRNMPDWSKLRKSRNEEAGGTAATGRTTAARPATSWSCCTATAPTATT